MLLWWLAAVAFAGDVYINGVDVGGLESQTFEEVTVTFDSNGDIHISAPGYQIEVLDPDGPAGTETTTSTVTEPVTTSTSTSPSGAVTTTTTTTGAPEPPPGENGIPIGRWWLVSEDNASLGHTIEVFINGSLARTIRSGEAQIIEDMGAWMQIGANNIRMQSLSTGEGGGSLYLYLGTGSNESGTLVMDPPDVQFGLGASRTGVYERAYSIEVAP